MMRLGRRAALFVAVYLLTSAATAYAECSWVLWVESQHPDYPQRTWWKINYTTDNLKDCRERLTKVVNEPLVIGGEKVPKGRVIGGDFIISESGGKTATYRYQCIPGTIDPRPRERD
jgi:hypothetical protein